MAEVRAETEPVDLTDAEHRMWEAYRTGRTCDLSARVAAQDDPHSDRPWGPERSVRAEVVALLLLHGPPPVPGRVVALKLRGVRILGRLELSGGRVEPYVEFQSCRFDSELQLAETRACTLRLVNCAIPRLEAARLHTEGDLHLLASRVARGIRLTDAQIGTDLLISRAVVRPDNKGRAITADGMSVAQDFQGDMLETYGEISLRGAKVGVSMNLRGARLRNPVGRRALNAPQLTVERTLYLTSIALYSSPGDSGTQTPPYGVGQTPAPGQASQAFECEGGMRLDDGRFGDAIDFYGARFLLSPEQEVSLRRISTPELRFVGAQPEQGRVVLSGAKVVKLVDLSTSWPGPGLLVMEGFSYEILAPRGHFPLPRQAGLGGGGHRGVLAGAVRAAGGGAAGQRGGRRRPGGAAGQAAAAARDPAARGQGLGLPPGLDGGLRVPAGAGGAVDGGAVGGGHAAVPPAPAAADQGGRASAVECRPVRPGSAAAGDRSGARGPVEAGRGLAVVRLGARGAGVDPGHHGGGGSLPAAEAGVTAAGPGPLPCAS